MAFCSKGPEDHIKMLQKIQIFLEEKMSKTLEKSNKKEVIFELLNKKINPH